MENNMKKFKIYSGKEKLEDIGIFYDINGNS